MSDSQPKNQSKRGPLSPWLLILLTAPIPLLVLVYFSYHWYSEKDDFSQASNQFVQRQNQVMAYDALAVAKEISLLLDRVAGDVQSLALIQPGEDRYKRFYQSHTSQLTEEVPNQSISRQLRLPLYASITFMNLNGNEGLRMVNGKPAPNRELTDCKLVSLCDRELREQLLRLPVGSVRVGSLMRYYIPNTSKEDAGGVFTIGYRGPTGLYELGVDYLHLRSFFFAPTFPYQVKTDLLGDYEKGNYVYLVDSNYDFLLHPKWWHVTGVDRNTGTTAEAVKTDSDAGAKRLNVSEYEGEKLKEYFKRLLNKSFVYKSVDIFRAPNLAGTNRVLSVAPVLTQVGQFSKTGVFGYVVIGCAVEYFEEPKEPFVPYY